MMADRGMSQDSWLRLERRITVLEEATGATKLSPQELSKVIHELLDLRQLFHAQMSSRPKIQDGLQKYRELLKIAEEQEGNSKGSFGLRSEVLLNELPRLRVLASSTESLQQLQSVLDAKPSDDLSRKIADLTKKKEELTVLLAKVERIERLHAALTDAETAVISLTEEKLVEIDNKIL